MRVLVLSGGGSKGAFQLGVLDQLYKDAACRYDAIFGVSTGALTASVLAQGSTASEQRCRLYEVQNLYFELQGNRSIYRGGSTLISKAWNLWRKGGMYDPSPLAGLVKKHVHPQALFSSKTHLGVGVTDLETGDYLSVTGREPTAIIKAILASAYQPIFFQLFDARADGGVRNMTPLGDAFRWIKGQREQDSSPVTIDVIVCSPVGHFPAMRVDRRNAIQVLLRTFSIIEHEIFITDLNRALKKNSDPKYIYADIRLWAPESDLGDGLEFDPERIRLDYRLGKKAKQNGTT